MAKVYITPPEGFEIPENKREGDTFEALVTLKLEKDGKLCVEALDGMPVTQQKEVASTEVPQEAGFEESFNQQADALPVGY